MSLEKLSSEVTEITVCEDWAPKKHDRACRVRIRFSAALRINCACLVYIEFTLSVPDENSHYVGCWVSMWRFICCRASTRYGHT